MKKKESHQEFLDEAIRIADELLAIAETDGEGISWKTIGFDKDLNPVVHKMENIYSGTCGVVLFLLELYKQTGKIDYADAAAKGLRWVWKRCQETPSEFYAFLTGWMGISYTFMKAARVLGDRSYMEKALTIARDCSSFLNSPGVVCDYLNGISGTIHALLHLHAASGEEWLLEKINQFLERLIKGANFGPRGLYWDRSPTNIHGLCGFSHGAGGIGFLFLELGYYFSNPTFHWLAEQCFLYETCFFDKRIGNWLDLRKDKLKNETYGKHEKAFQDGNLSFFLEGLDINAWCHGAAGNGLSRLRAYELLGNEKYKEDIQSAIAKTIATNIQAEVENPLFILCHGGGGNAELFLEAARVYGDKHFQDLAEQIGRKALSFYKEHKEYLSGYRFPVKEGNTSLFMGNAGIGYLYLRLFDPDHVDSIVIPRLKLPLEKSIPDSKFRCINISIASAKGEILTFCFRRTMHIAREVMPEKLHSFLSEQGPAGEVWKEKFIQFLENIIPTLPEQLQARFEDVFGLEKRKVHIDEDCKSHVYLFIKEMVLGKEANALNKKIESEFLKEQLVLDGEIVFTRWNWDLAAEADWLANQEKPAGNFPVLLKARPSGVEEYNLGLLPHIILSTFQNWMQVKKAIQEINNKFEEITIRQKKELRKQVIMQIKNALVSGVLKSSKWREK